MADLEALSREVRDAVPGVEVTTDLEEDGSGFIDCRVRDQFFVLEWRKGTGFGVSECKKDDVFDWGHDVWFAEAGDASHYLQKRLREG